MAWEAKYSTVPVQFPVHTRPADAAKTPNFDLRITAENVSHRARKFAHLVHQIDRLHKDVAAEVGQADHPVLAGTSCKRGVGGGREGDPAMRRNQGLVGRQLVVSLHSQVVTIRITRNRLQ